MIYNSTQDPLLRVAVEMLYTKVSGELFSDLAMDDKIDYIANRLNFHLFLSFSIETTDGEFKSIGQLAFTPNIEELTLDVAKNTAYTTTEVLFGKEILENILTAYFRSLYGEPAERQRETFIRCILVQSLMDISIQIKKDGSIKLDTQIGTGDIFR